MRLTFDPVALCYEFHDPFIDSLAYHNSAYGVAVPIEAYTLRRGRSEMVVADYALMLDFQITTDAVVHRCLK